MDTRNTGSRSSTSLACSKKLTDTRQRLDAVRWLPDTFYIAESGSVPKAEVYAAYIVYCGSRNNEEPFSVPVFGRLVVYEGVTGHRPARLRAL